MQVEELTLTNSLWAVWFFWRGAGPSSTFLSSL